MTPAQRSKQARLEDKAAGRSDPEKRNPSTNTMASQKSQGSASAQTALNKFEERLFDPSRIERLVKTGAALKARQEDKETLDILKKYQQKSKKARAKWIHDHEQRLIQVAHNAYPQRMELPILICDVWTDRAQVTVGKLSEIERCKCHERQHIASSLTGIDWKEKPEDAIIRWM